MRIARLTPICALAWLTLAAAACTGHSGSAGGAPNPLEPGVLRPNQAPIVGLPDVLARRHPGREARPGPGLVRLRARAPGWPADRRVVPRHARHHRRGPRPRAARLRALSGAAGPRGGLRAGGAGGAGEQRPVAAAAAGMTVRRSDGQAAGRSGGQAAGRPDGQAAGRPDGQPPPTARPPDRLTALANTITHCERCPRLRAHCREIARVRKRAHATDEYWGRPVPSLGDPLARLLIIGLAPAAHGANRTGQLFTGDASGSWLYEALHRFGFSNRPNALWRGDGLVLTDCWITASAHCAPPQNRPTPAELARCRPYLETELTLLPKVEVVLALGRVSWETWLRAAGWWQRLAAARAAGLRPRRGDRDARRARPGHVVSPEPPEHEHGKADAGDVVWGVREDPATARRGPMPQGLPPSLRSRVTSYRYLRPSVTA